MDALSPLVYLIDDDDDVREALALLLRTMGMRVDAFADPLSFLSAFDRNTIGCLIVDIRMPGMTGLQLQQRLLDEQCDLPVVVITGHGDLNLCRRAFKAGAVEFLIKPVDEEALLDSVQKAVTQHIRSRRQQTLTREAQARLSKLTDRENEILVQIVEGLSNKQIARVLDLSPRTVETHRANIFAKLETQSLAELVRLYLTGVSEHGYSPLSGPASP
ncbi:MULTISPECIES: response regulator transcription factor [Leeia]|uniref:Response regulator transcription factor n=1 Tax=Leeia aquatica TaxID=2725557 RepID=A0A847SDL2_9NEIS|nr:response regulator [Leeia aquatica]NLR75526.1 response regulator transcription factor [Leeia aquatica]